MKHARLIWTSLALMTVVALAAFAVARGVIGKAGATSSTHTAQMAGEGAAMNCDPSECPPEMCIEKGAHATATVTADLESGQCPHLAKGAAMNCDPSECPPEMCIEKGDRATAAVASHAKPGAATKASAAGCCARDARATTAVAAGAGERRASSVTPLAAVHCDGCADLARCLADIAEVGGKVQVVPLKNGVMYVYSAESSSRVRAVQAAVTRHAHRLAGMTAVNDKTRLCADCREMRGAAASGKLTREVVNIESGCLTLATSSDPRIVTRLYAQAGVQSGTTRGLAKS